MKLFSGLATLTENYLINVNSLPIISTVKRRFVLIEDLNCFPFSPISEVTGWQEQSSISSLYAIQKSCDYPNTSAQDLHNPVLIC